jgi:hypothetical protein
MSLVASHSEGTIRAEASQRYRYMALLGFLCSSCLKIGGHFAPMVLPPFWLRLLWGAGISEDRIGSWAEHGDAGDGGAPLRL